MKSQDYQVLLSFGYLYIVILGILKEAFFYSQLGVDYFNYASITDILISPIADIASSLTTILVFLGFLFLIFQSPKWFANRREKSWVQKSFNFESGKEFIDARRHVFNVFSVAFCLGLMGFFIGKGIGAGVAINKKIKNEKLKFKDKISYINGQTDTINLIGKNSSFLFYIPKGKKEIEIAPINNGLLKSIIENK